MGGTSFPQSLPWDSGTQGMWEEQMPLRNEAKVLLSTPAFSISVVTRSLSHHEGTISFVFLFWLSYLQKPLLFFTSLKKFSSSCALSILIPSLHSQAVSLYSFRNPCPCLYCLCISLLCFSLTRRSLLGHSSLLPSLPYFLKMRIKLLYFKENVFR